MNELILYIFFLIILYFLFSTENMEIDFDRNFKFLNNKFAVFVKNKTYANDEKIEIKKLQKIIKKITVDYSSNTNYIINNNVSIYQNIKDTLENTIEINNKNFNLTSVRWKKSKLSYNGKEVGLELQLVHQNYNSINKVIIVIPLDFILDYDSNSENFINIGYNKKLFNSIEVYNDLDIYKNNNFVAEKIIEPAIKEEITNKYNLDINYKNRQKYLNTVLISDALIPIYNCCADTIGQLGKFDFFDLKNYLCNITNLSQLEDHNNNLYLIVEPIGILNTLGFAIRNKIKDDNITVYLNKEPKL